MKLFHKCFGCKRKKIAVNKVAIIIPGAGEVTSKEHFCYGCSSKLKRLSKSWK